MKVWRFLDDQSGAMLAEYALLFAIVLGGAACTAVFLGDAISDAITHAGDAIRSEWHTVTSDEVIR